MVFRVVDRVDPDRVDAEVLEVFDIPPQTGDVEKRVLCIRSAT